jgi:hypothetical protein
VGGRCRRMAGSAAYQRVDRSYSLIAQNEGSVTDQTEKAFVFSAETEISWCPFPTEAGAPVGTRLPGALRNILNSDRNFKPLPTDRKRGADALIGASEHNLLSEGHLAKQPTTVSHVRLSLVYDRIPLAKSAGRR